MREHLFLHVSREPLVIWGDSYEEEPIAVGDVAEFWISFLNLKSNHTFVALKEGEIAKLRFTKSSFALREFKIIK